MQVICHILCAACMMGGAREETVSPAWCSNTLLSPSFLPHLTQHLLSSADTEKAPQSPVCSQRAPGPSWSTKTERLEGGGTQHGRQEFPTLSYNQPSLQPDGFASCPGAKKKEITSVTATGQGLPLVPHVVAQPWAVGQTREHKGHGHEVVHHRDTVLEISQQYSK